MKKLTFIIVATILSINSYQLNAFAEKLSFKDCTTLTSNESQCKDCCDCLDVDAATRRQCRQACTATDFRLNSRTMAMKVPSILGPDGDYSVALKATTEQACKEYCDGSDELACGDRRYCRDACNAAYFKNSPERKHRFGSFDRNHDGFLDIN
ncbi:hypothetical protein SAMN05660337_2798 [Maridesulfovibrio ferrireducens]|uniref:EF-hand domain-containing protein n=1 Tax=Maridesulfovibrio ferrireducens TaxID=246191 RepID=A0A1G9JHD2_9BACT|nr:hypothetical protein [Maridesulfovibrio ferrireducens]SDL36980.1 hypothetical protein SAMN05660337_2798 [Maridesulfovibrio ferrireducens]